MAAPPSQKYRQIGFHLISPVGQSADFTFAIRPEELTRQEPTRLTVNQTLGGAWADAFDRGVSTITLSGHNGWRGGFISSGEDMFQALRDTCFAGWNDQRTLAVKSGIDPSRVELYFTDSLDNITALVAPKSFSLRRSRSSPLLIRYQIQLLVLDDAAAPKSLVDSIIDALSNPVRWLASVTGLGNVLNVIQNYATMAQNVLGAIAGAARQFINVGVSLIQSVKQVAQDTQGEFDSASIALLSAGTMFSQAASGAFTALAGNDTLPASQRIPLMALASNFNDAACSMANGFNVGRYFTSFTDLFGASACSSTGGGDDWSLYTAQNLNPFEALVPITTPAVMVSADAHSALTMLRSDPLELVGQPATIGSLMATAAGGVTLP